MKTFATGLTTLTAALLLMALTFSADDPPIDNVEGYIIRAKARDREALGALYQHYVRRIHRYIASRVDNAHDVEDLTAEVFVEMVKRIENYTFTGAPFESWLYRIAATGVAQHYRKQVKTSDEDIELVADTLPSTDELIDYEQSIHGMLTALKRLPEEYQTLLVLRFVERKSHAEVAAIMERSVTAVKSMQHRALIQLTELMGVANKSRHYLRGHRE